MSNKKIERLLDCIINQDQDLARSLFHEIVVEKSRKIYNEANRNSQWLGPEFEKIMQQYSSREKTSDPLNPFRDIAPGFEPSDAISDPQERDRMMEPIRRPSQELFQQMIEEFHDLRRSGLDTEEALDRIRADLEQDEFEWSDDEIASILGDLNINDIEDDEDQGY